MLSLFRNWYLRHFSQPGTTEFALVLAAAFIAVYYFMWLLGPLVVALCIAYCLDGPVRLMMRRCSISRASASAIVMLAFISLAVTIMVLVVPRVIKQGAEFYDIVVSISQDAGGGRAATGYNIDAMLAHELMALIASLPDPLPDMLSEESVRRSVNHLRMQGLSSIAEVMRTQLMPSVINAFAWLMYLIVVPIFAYLMLRGKRDLQRRVRTYLLPNNQILMNDFWPSLNTQIGDYIRGKVLHIIIITIANTAAFMLMGLNYAFLLGLGVGLSVVVPYVGAVIIALPVVFVAIFQFGFSMTLGWVLAVYLIIQLLDSNVLTPMIFSKAMNLDAFSILAAIMIFGGLWGFWGVFFAIPLATLIRTLITRWPSLDSRSGKAADPSRFRTDQPPRA